MYACSGLHCTYWPLLTQWQLWLEPYGILSCRHEVFGCSDTLLCLCLFKSHKNKNGSGSKRTWLIPRTARLSVSRAGVDTLAERNTFERQCPLSDTSLISINLSTCQMAIDDVLSHLCSLYFKEFLCVSLTTPPSATSGSITD